MPGEGSKHMKLSWKIGLVALAIAVLVTAPGCGKKQAAVTDEPVAAVETPPPPPPPRPPVQEVEDDGDFQERTEPIEQPRLSIRELNERGVLQTVYFDFDRSELTGLSQQILRRNADWLKNNREYNVVIEGHCDNRGTIEYNLALGQRRASEVRDFLSAQGVAQSRMRTVTYGEERPAVQGNSESAWSKNRRAQFVLED